MKAVHLHLLSALCQGSVALLSFSSAFAAPAPELKAITAANATDVRPRRELPGFVWEIAWGPKRGELSLLSWEKPIEVVDASTFKPLRQIASDKRLVHFAVQPGGEKLAWCENNTLVEIHDVKAAKGVVIDTLNSQPSMAFSPDGKLLATGGAGTQVKVWDVPSGKLMQALEAGGEGGLRAVFSPDGKRIAIGNRNDAALLYETETGQLLHTLPKKMTHELKFSPDGLTLAVAYVDGTISLWDTVTGNVLHTQATGAKELYSLDWSPKGDVLATSGREGKIMLWEPGKLKVLKELDAPEWVICVRFSPDGTRLLSAGGGQTSNSERKTIVWTVEGR